MELNLSLSCRSQKSQVVRQGHIPSKLSILFLKWRKYKEENQYPEFTNAEIMTRNIFVYFVTQEYFPSEVNFWRLTLSFLCVPIVPVTTSIIAKSHGILGVFVCVSPPTRTESPWGQDLNFHFSSSVHGCSSWYITANLVFLNERPERMLMEVIRVVEGESYPAS